MKHSKLMMCMFFLFQASFSYAGDYFENLRNDQAVPEACRTTKMAHFADGKNLTYFTVSITGAVRRGFTYEYPIVRRDVRKLWGDFNPSKSTHQVGDGEIDNLLQPLAFDFPHDQISKDQDYQANYNLIRDNMEFYDFDMGSEGQILELLATLAFAKEIDMNKYFISGSVEYHGSKSFRTIGELDFIVGLRDNCQVLAVGEAKVGVGSLGHAKQQMQRFRSFLANVSRNFMLSKLLPEPDFF